MKTELVANRCPKCQGPLPADAPQGLCPKCLLAAVATPTEAGQPANKVPPPPLAEVAAAFPQLEIVELIGQGGMGLVYKARQPKLDRFVALKLLPQALAADPSFAERFNREARVLARLNHPNIVTVHDFGQAGGFFYLLMEFVDGVNLRQAMQAGRFTPQQAMLIVPRICEALQFAHDEGILHRDIKPENILLDTHGRVKIADFGIAKLVGEAREQLALTASGMAMGTPHYMAPEQLEHPKDVDQRADIYSLGVVFYEMLTGELPLGRFAPPSQKTPVDPRVDAVVFHALEKEREKRFRSATEVKTSVEAITGSAASGDPAARCAAGPGGRAGGDDVDDRATCYFNTPKRMKDCFPSAAARVFTCKGELELGREELTFTTPWRTTIRIALKEIQDLSIGQFQMWTTPWVMKYARLNFLAVSFRQAGQVRTVHLTPVPPGTAPVDEINSYVGRWFERVQQAVHRHSGATPHASGPELVTISAEPAWNRKGLPVTFGFMLTWLGAWLLLPHRGLPARVGLALMLVSIPLLVLTFSFVVGFLKANRALWRGELEAVTSDEPPAEEPGGAATTGAGQGRKRRWPQFSLSFWGVVGVALVAPVGLLLWEAWVSPSLGQRLLGARSTPGWAGELVLDRVPPQYGPESHDPRQAGGQVWDFKTVVPPDHWAQVLFVRWTNGVARVEPGFSGYFKTGHAAANLDFIISCEPQPDASSPGVTPLLLWNVHLGLGYTRGGLVPTLPSFGMLDTPERITVRSGHQRIIRLVDCRDSELKPGAVPDGVELRVFLEPLKSPAVRAVPSEKELENCIGGPGLERGMDETLRLMQQLPVDE